MRDLLPDDPVRRPYVAPPPPRSYLDKFNARPAPWRRPAETIDTNGIPADIAEWINKNV